MVNSIDEKRKSLKNSSSDILEARIVANYGDPGLDEDYHFDILSRYLIVIIESAYRVPTVNKWNKLFAIVKRPEYLWVNAEGGKASSPNSQKRSDGLGNISIGLAGSFTANGIPRMNLPYRFGELIKIKKISYPLIVGQDTIFQSEFSESNFTYGTWHTEGSTLPYFSGNQDRIDFLKAKTIYRPDDNDLFTYGVTLYKYQYEAFLLNLFLGNDSLTSYATSLFTNTLLNSNPIYNADGGFVFKGNDFVNLSALEYEDINIENRTRAATNECMPLVVATPQSFPTPKVRSVGMISYNPTYSPVLTET